MPRVKIERMSFGAYGVAHLDGMSVLVPNAAPGDELEVELVSRKGSYAIARVVEVVRAGEARREPPCKFLPRCGGCDWQQLSYSGQIAAKRGLIRSELLSKIPSAASLDFDINSAPEEFAYRSRIRLKLENGRVGFHEASSNRLVEIDRCLVADPALSIDFAAEIGRIVGKSGEEIELAAVKAGQVAVVWMKRPPTDKQLAAMRTLVEGEKGAGIVVRAKSMRQVLGSSEIEIEIEPGLKVSIEADAFTQVNHPMNRALVARVMELTNPLAGRRVLDVFCGAANFSLPAARRGAEVLGIDSDPIAIAAAERNAARLGMTSARFASQDASENAKFLLRAGYRPDLVILDPPRSGARELMAPIAKLRPPVLIYVSCDVSTLARDLTLLSSEYDVRSISAFDFFPNTHHFETVAQAVLT